MTMTLFNKQVSAALALVMFFTSVINTVLVACTSGSDHQAIELIGHQTGLTDHSADTFTFTTHTSEHEAHPENCTDTSLLADTLTQRDNLSANWEDNTSQLWLAYPLDDRVAPNIAFAPSHWPANLHTPPTWAAIDDLSTIRLLI
jgi:hypothetical protein